MSLLTRDATGPDATAGRAAATVVSTLAQIVNVPGPENLAGEVTASSAIWSRNREARTGWVRRASNTLRRLLLERSPRWSGFIGQVLSGDLARIFNVPQAAAVLVERVANGSPAASIGLRGGVTRATVEGRAFLVGGDIVLGVDGISLATFEGYQRVQERLGTITNRGRASSWRATQSGAPP